MEIKNVINLIINFIIWGFAKFNILTLLYGVALRYGNQTMPENLFRIFDR